jgi:hypothetical protein
MKRIIVFILFLRLVVSCSTSEDVAIVVSHNQSLVEKTAAEQLQKYLSKIYPNDDFTITSEMPSDSRKVILIGDIQKLAEHKDFLPEILPEEPESYSITTSHTNNREAGVITGYDDAGTLYGVYALLEKLGCGFYLSYETLPEERKNFEFTDWNLTNSPEYPMRMVFNWHNFLSGITTWNIEEWNLWIEQSAKMKYNTIMIHSYGNNPMMEFEFNGEKKEVGYLANTAKGRDWGTNHTNDVRRLYGAGSFFEDSIFGAEVSKVPNENRVEAAVHLAQEAFKKADEYGMDVAFTFDVGDPNSLPLNIVNTLPEYAKLETMGTWYPNPDTDEGFEYYKAQAEQILKMYPQIDYFVPWVRYRVPEASSDFMRVKQFPDEWERDFNSGISIENLEDNTFTRSMYFIGKICKAYQQAIDELGFNEVKMGIGTWHWAAFPTMDLFLPEEYEFFPLDWYMNFHTDSTVNTLTSIDTSRKVHPVVWAHHDDHRYIGKPYTPYENFADMLKQRNSSGFGIIHWTTRPLDIYFKSLSQQVWQQTLNEPLEETVKEFAEKTFETEAPVFKEYIYQWITRAAMFGRETSEYFYDMKDTEPRLKRFQLGEYGNPLDYPENAVKEAQKRLNILNEIDTIRLTEQGRDWYRYFYGFEKFVISFNQNQKYLIEAFDLIEEEEFTRARETLSKANPEETIRLYSEFSSQGYITQGEKGLIVSLNLRWLPDFYVFMQKLRMIPVKYNYAPTFHEHMARSAGEFTFFYTEDKQVWRSMGKKETGVEVKVANGISFSDETAASYIESEQSLELEVGIWRPLRRLEEWQNNSLLPGKYELELTIYDPDLNQINNRVFDIQIVDQNGMQITGNRVDLYNESKPDHSPIRIKMPFSVEQGQKLKLRMIPIKGNIILNSMVIHPVE